MKVLVTGENGKIGKAFLDYVKERKSEIYAEAVSLREESWKTLDFSSYDVIYYCIGIVDPSNPEMFRVNTTLAYEVAKKAKEENVKKFIYLSSMAVYDFSGNCNMSSIVEDTKANATNAYGESKLKGENVIKALSDSSFNVHIIRAPSIYGRETEAYLDFIKNSSRRFFFDAFHDWKRSILYVDNLSELVCLITETPGVLPCSYYYPQNKERYSYAELVKIISEVLCLKRKKISLSAKWEARLRKLKFVRRKYRPYMYSSEISNAFNYRYCKISAADSIALTLKANRGFSFKEKKT